MPRKLLVMSGATSDAEGVSTPYYYALDTTTADAATEIGTLVLGLVANAKDGAQTPVNVSVVELVNG